MTYNVLMGTLNPTHSLTHYCIETANDIIKLLSLPGSPVILVF